MIGASFMPLESIGSTFPAHGRESERRSWVLWARLIEIEGGTASPGVLMSSRLLYDSVPRAAGLSRGSPHSKVVPSKQHLRRGAELNYGKPHPACAKRLGDERISDARIKSRYSRRRPACRRR